MIMENEMDDNNFTKTNRTYFSSRTIGVAETRKFFDLISHTVALSAGHEDQDDRLVDLELLLKQTWNIYGVSVLFDFESNDEVKLKQYAKKLREEVASILSHDNVSYETKFEVLDIHRPKETDHPVVKIEVYARTNNSNNNESCVYKGYMLSWRSESEAVTGSAKYLPLMLCRGTPNTMRAVHATLNRMFDCLIIGMPTNAEDLAWLLPIVLSPGGGQDTANPNDEAMLEFTVPGLPVTDSITIKFHVESLINLWNSILGDSIKIDFNKIEKFHKVLQKQILDISNLELGLCILHRIHLPSITISGTKMKIANIETMDTVLTYLNEKALDTLHTNASQLSVSK